MTGGLIFGAPGIDGVLVLIRVDAVEPGSALVEALKKNKVVVSGRIVPLPPPGEIPTAPVNVIVGSNPTFPKVESEQ